MVRKSGGRILPVLAMTAVLCLSCGCRGDDAAPSADVPVSARAILEDVQPPEPTPLERLQMLAVPDLPEQGGDAARYVLDRNVMDLREDGTFDPDCPLTRAELASALFRLSGEAGAQSPPEEDAAAWALAEGILDDPDTPGAPVSRCSLALALWNYARPRGYPAELFASLDGFPDVDAVPDAAAEAVSWALGNELFRSFTAESLRPGTAVSRLQLAQALTALERYHDPLAGEIFQELPVRSAGSAARKNREQIQDALEQTARKYGAVGVQLAVVEDGAVTGSFAWGWATRDTEPMTPEHKIRTASLSKIEVGLAAAILAEDGTVDLDASIGKYWGCTVQNPGCPERPVSIRTLLSHTSSLRDPGDGISTAYDSVRYRLASGEAFSSGRKPGDLSSWGYNNYGFAVLGMTLELAAERTLDNILGERLFVPMDIDASFEAGDIQETYLLTTLYRDGSSVARTISVQLSQHAQTPGASGANFAGGFTASAGDLAKIAALLAADGMYEGLRLLPETAVKQIESHGDETVSDGFYQALPLRLRPDAYGRKRLFYHTGSAYGVFNCFSYDPDSRDGIVVLSVGASGVKDENGIYAVCGDLMEAVYPLLD